MEEHRRKVLMMLRDGEINLEKAEEMLEFPAGISAPRRVCVIVTENGRKKTDIKMPIQLVLLGLKMGRGLGLRENDFINGEIGTAAIEILKRLDAEKIIAEIRKGAVSLPCIALEIENTENAEHIKVILE